MGYYALAFEGEIVVPKSNIKKAGKAIRKAFVELNKTRPEVWKEPIFDDLTEALDWHCFEYSTINDSGDIHIYGFDAKWREQETLLQALTNFVTPESEMAFRGEDGEMWKWTPGRIWVAKIGWVSNV